MNFSWVWTRSQPEHVDCRERDSIAKCPGELVVAGGDATEVLEAADRGLDPPALLVSLLVVADLDEPVLPARDDRLDATVTQLPSQGVGVVGAVGDEALAGADLGEQRVDAPDVAVMAGGQVDGDRSPEEVGGEVDLGGPSAARDANGLILRRFFLAPAADR